MLDADVVKEIGTSARFERSADAPGRGPGAVLEWMAERVQANRFTVTRIRFQDLSGWEFHPDSGNLGHRSGKFFTVEGARVVVDGNPYRQWHQPVINQPEAGIIGLLAREFDGILHFLVQAKMEPGNCNIIQLSPTVQATRSNYRKAHQGLDVRYLDYFVQPQPSRVLVDVLQSEPGTWFWRKTNRNMIVEATADVELHDDFRWMTLGEINGALRSRNVVNMNLRGVLGCMPVSRSGDTPLHTEFDVLSWFTDVRSRRTLTADRVPLRDLPGWQHNPWSVDPVGGAHFSIVAVFTEAANREVTSWSQPLIEPHPIGVNAFLTRRINGTLHVLAQARVEPGLVNEVELAPTVQAAPENHPADRQPMFLDRVLAARPDRIRYDTVLSEEGGRLLNAENRYLIIDDDTNTADAPPGFCWVTPGQLSSLVAHSHYVNSQARTLLAGLNAGRTR